MESCRSHTLSLISELCGVMYITIVVISMNACTIYVMKHSANGIITSMLHTRICTDTCAKVENIFRGMNGAMTYDKHHQIHLSYTFSMFTDSLVTTDFWVWPASDGPCIVISTAIFSGLYSHVLCD